MKCNLLILTALALLSAGSTAPGKDFSDLHKSTCGSDSRKHAPEEEVLLYTHTANATYQEIKSVGGRVTLQLGRNLIVAKVPSGSVAMLDLKTASQSIPPMASDDAVIDTYVRAYKAAVEDLKKPTPVVRRWNELSAPKVLPGIQYLAGTAPAIYSPTMSGKIVIILLMPSGPGNTAMSDAHRDNALSEVLAGVKWWADTAPAAQGLSFVTYYARVNINTPGNANCCPAGPNPDFSACDTIFANPTQQALGYAAGAAGRTQMLQTYTDHENAAGGVVGFITHYTLCHFAYASFAGGPLYMDYDNDGWGPNQIDRVFAHELGHTFNAPDEYTGCNCNRDYGEGACTAKNGNCNDDNGPDCTNNQVNCIMDSNDFALCAFTPSHVGWC